MCKKEELVPGQVTDNTPLIWQVNVKLVYFVLPLALWSRNRAIGQLPGGLAEKLQQ